MARVCEITGKKPAVANNVSHANNRTKRRQLPNLHSKSMMSELLGHNVTLRISTNAMRTVDKYGNIDEFMLNYKHSDSFSTSAARIRKAIKKAHARTTAAA